MSSEAQRRAGRKYYRAHRAKRAAYYQANRRARLNYQFVYVANKDAERMGRAGRLAVDELPAGDCAYCCSDATGWDHVVPLAQGGLNLVENLVPCCFDCNNAKNARTPEEWFAGAPDYRAK